MHSFKELTNSDNTCNRLKYRLNIAVLWALTTGTLHLAMSCSSQENPPVNSSTNSADCEDVESFDAAADRTNLDASADLATIVPSDAKNDSMDSDSNTCIEQTVRGKTLPLDMYLMVDQSGSMGLHVTGSHSVTKWQALTEAVDKFVSTHKQPELSMGIQFFPLPVLPWDQIPACKKQQDCGKNVCMSLDVGGRCLKKCIGNADCPGGSECLQERGSSNRGCSNDSCDPHAYAVADVPIQPLSEVGSKIIDSIKAHGPLTLTPTGPAIEGAMIYATQWAKKHPDHRTVVLLATDGRPTVCPEQDSVDERVEAVIKIIQRGVAYSPSIKTFIIGVQEAWDWLAVQNMHAFAKAGGTNQAFIIEPNKDMIVNFSQALERIRSGVMDCEFRIPDSDAELNYEEVNVELVDSSNVRTTVYYVEENSACQGSETGWYYDTNPQHAAPKQILLCPSTCELAKKKSAQVDFAIGCATLRPPK